MTRSLTRVCWAIAISLCLSACAQGTPPTTEQNLATVQAVYGQPVDLTFRTDGTPPAAIDYNSPAGGGLGQLPSISDVLIDEQNEKPLPGSGSILIYNGCPFLGQPVFEYKNVGLGFAQEGDLLIPVVASSNPKISECDATFGSNGLTYAVDVRILAP